MQLAMSPLFEAAAPFFRRREERIPQRVRDASFAVLDLEMTGLDVKKDDIVCFGAVRMDGGRMHRKNSFHRYAAPRCAMNPDAEKVHGLSVDFLAPHPTPDRLLDEFLHFVGDAVIVGWRVGLDVGFLDAERKRQGLKPLKNPVVDVYDLFQHIRDRGASALIADIPRRIHDLYTPAKALGVDCAKAHDALGDAVITAELFGRFLSILDPAQTLSVDELVRIKARPQACSW